MDLQLAEALMTVLTEKGNAVACSKNTGELLLLLFYIIGISFMQGVYTYIPGTNRYPGEHCIAAILMLLFMVHRSLVPALTPLYLYVSTFRSMCAVPTTAVFCNSSTS